MKVSKVTLITLLSCSVVAGPALAQTLRHPASVQPVSLTYDYYADEESSPSDVAPIPAEPAPLDSSRGTSRLVQGLRHLGRLVHSCGNASGGCSCHLFGDGEAFKLIPDSDCRAGPPVSGHRSVTTPKARTGMAPDCSTTTRTESSCNSSGHTWRKRSIRAAVVLIGVFDWTMCTARTAQTPRRFGGFDWDNDWDNGGAYGHALPQAYLEVGYNRLKAKIGHFFTIVRLRSRDRPR